VSRSVKRWHNMDIVLHGPMPSKPCPQSTYAQGRHAFTAPVRGIAMSSVTTNAGMQIVEVAPLLRLRTERCCQMRLVADEAKCTWSKMADGTFAAADARKRGRIQIDGRKQLLLSSYGTHLSFGSSQFWRDV
jgi:hypothetical protein